MIEKILPQKQIEKSEHRDSSRFRNEPRKNYKIFIPQSRILKQVEFQKTTLILKINNFCSSGSF